MYILSGKTGYLTNILNVMDYSFLERSKYKKNLFNYFSGEVTHFPHVYVKS